MGRRVVKARHLTTLGARFAGDHDTKVEIVLNTVRVLIPGLVVTLTDSEAARCWWRAWWRASRIAPDTFDGRKATPYQVSPITRMYTAVTATGWQSGHQIYGRGPLESPSGCGELRVRVGNIAIICDDRDAYDRQLVTWALAYDAGRRFLWADKLRTL